MQFLQKNVKIIATCAFKRKNNSIYESKATNEMYSQVAKSPKIWKLKVQCFYPFPSSFIYMLIQFLKN
jgi:hypothetical protein